MADTSGIIQFMMVNTIGMSILSHALTSAACYLSTADGISRSERLNGRKSLVFIQGTGLEAMMSYYHIGYDPDDLRRSFFTMFHRNDLIR